MNPIRIAVNSIANTMDSAVAGRRRNARHSAEDQALDQIAKEVHIINMRQSIINENIINL